MNALKHGLTGQQVVLLGEDVEEFENFSQILSYEFRPKGLLEEILVEKIVAEAWRLRRARVLEVAVYQREELRAKLGAARHEVTKFERDVFQLQGLPTEVEPKDREAHKQAQEAYRKLEAEPTAPSISLLGKMEKCEEATAKLERYEATRFQAFLKALHELERLQARRAGEDVPVPAVLDVDLSVCANDTTTPE
jgi:hypothetical protein